MLCVQLSQALMMSFLKQVVLASGWVLVCSVYSAIIHFLYSRIILLNLLGIKCRQIGSR